MTDLVKYEEAAIEAAKAAGAMLLAGLNEGERVIEFKGDNDIVTEMDRRAEEMVVEALTSAFPDIAILAEEGGASGPESDLKWIIDPLDGTNSYAHRVPHFCVSIGLEMSGEPAVGVVYNPCLDECFTAVKGKGACLNGKPIRVSATAELKKSLVATGFPYDRATSPENNVNYVAAFIPKIQGIRRMGSAALDLCYTAAGRFDGYWELKLQPWDTAAGALILTEAGGSLTDFDGGAYSIYDKQLLASNGQIHDQMIDVLQQA